MTELKSRKYLIIATMCAIVLISLTLYSYNLYSGNIQLSTAQPIVTALILGICNSKLKAINKKLT